MPASATAEAFLSEVASFLGTSALTPDTLRTLLERVLAHFECTMGTLHRLDAKLGLLQLQAHRGLPLALRDRVEGIPIGKGMAGLAAERRQPVQVCNLQTDCSGVARPGARATGMEGAIAIPIVAGDKVVGVLGIAKPVAHEFSAAETALLQEIAGLLARTF